ncbi:MAG: hypothetical protein ACAH95_00995 [Fimbriimonas sp.]
MATFTRTAESRSGLRVFLFALLAIVVLRLVTAFAQVPIAVLGFASIVVSVLFIAIPILGFYRGASFPWTWKEALLAVVCGGLIQFLFAMAATPVKVVFLSAVLMACSQTGLLLWCFGVGALLASILKDKNVILPISIFLALFDIWLVFAPEGIASQAIGGKRPELQQMMQGLSYQVPALGGYARPMAYVGPADFLFIAMFFVALFRFKMRTRETFLALVPTLAVYLLVVLMFGNVMVGPFRLGALPALLPIGLVILLVNWGEFRLTKDELASTIAVFVIGSALVTWRLIVSNSAPEPPVAPLRQEPDLRGLTPAGWTVPAPPDRFPS